MKKIISVFLCIAMLATCCVAFASCGKKTFEIAVVTDVGQLMDGGFNQVYVFMNDRVRASAEIIDTWVYTQGLGKAQYSLTTAVGLMKSVLSCGLVLGTNALARKWDSSLW